MRFYNPKGSLIDYVGDILNPTIEYEINVPPLYRFSVPAPLQWKIPLDATFTSEFGDFIVKEKSKNHDEYDFVCKPDFSTLQANVVSKAYVTITAQEMLDDLLSGSGWTGISSGTIKRTATITELTPYEGLEKIAKAFKYEIEFDAVSKTITMEPRIGRTISGVYFHDEFNLREVGVRSDSYDLITRLIPKGADGIGIESVNGGVPYVENYTYTDKIRTSTWTDGRYTDLFSLKADAIEKLEALAKPRKTFEVDVINVAIDPDYEFLEYRAGDVIDLKSVREGIDEVQRIVKIVRHPSAPEEDTLTIANAMRDYTVDLADAVEIVQEEFSNTRASLELLDESIEARVETVVVERVPGMELPIYTWIKYADDDQGSGISDTPIGKTYIGIASGQTTATESDDPTAYVWSKIEGPPGIQGLPGLQGPEGDQGIPGPKGDDGVSNYTHIAYANSADGEIDFSTSDSSRDYIGMYVDTLPTDSTDPSDYKWTLIKGADGTNGTPGAPGADGRTPYLHIAYATNSTGTTGFSTTDSVGKTYIGQYTDFEEVDSTDPDDYSWTLIKGADGYTPVKGTDYFDGKDGQDGTSSYLWVRYSQNANGSGMTTDPAGAKYIGTATTTTDTIPDYTLFNWSLIKGTDGLPGEDGEDGRTSYLHIKYSNDGGATFTANNGETVGEWIGTCVDFTEADPTTVGAYTWNKVKGEKGEQGNQGPQGIEGPKGDDGTTYYTWIKYADTPTSGMSNFPDGKTYMGIAHNKITETESLTYSDYTWSLIKGEQGVEGPAGDDGTTTYTWVKYADTATGSGMSDSPAGKRFLGLAHNKTTATESSSASDYQWSPLYDNVQVGGRNLLLDSQTLRFQSSMEGTYLGRPARYFSGGFASRSTSPAETYTVDFRAGETYTFSFEAAIVGTKGSYLRLSTGAFEDLTDVQNWENVTEGKFTKVFITKTFTSDETPRMLISQNSAGQLYYCNFKVERGNVPTDWTLAPEELDQKITTLSASVDVLAGEVNLKASKTEVTNETKDLVASSIVEYYLSTSSTSPVGGSWSETAPPWVNGQFMWSRTKVTTKAGAVTYHPNANGTNITGATGASGSSGADGRGITSTAIHYAVSSSGTVTPTSWSTSIPSVAPEQYLWTRTTINYDSGSPSVSYSIGQAGKSGSPGAPGSPGEDGRSLTSSALHYQKSTSGTTIPTGTWRTTIPTVEASEYLWTRTTFNYSSAPSPTYAYSVGKMGDTGRGIDSITPQYYLSTSNTTQTGGSWSTTPPAFNKDKYLWTRSYIVWNNPTGTSTTTPVLSTEWNTLADHEVRVQNAEQKITPEAITSTVEDRVSLNGSTVLSTKSELQQTKDAITATFSQIGGANVLLNSRQNLTNNTYQHSDYPLGAEIPKEGDTYTVTVKFSLGAGRTSLDLYSSNGYRKLVGFTNADRDSNGIASKTFTVSYYPGRTPADGYNLFSLYQAPNTGTSNTTVEWVKLEKGKVSTDWTPNPDELYTGVTRIDKDGVEVSRSDLDIKTRLAYDGTHISDAHGPIANFGETTYMPFANIDKVQSEDVVGTVTNWDHAQGNYTYQIGEGRPYATVSAALDDIFSHSSRRFLINDTNVSLYINGTIEDDIILRGIAGNGRIYIYFQNEAKLYGTIWIRDCMNRIYIRSSTTSGTGRGMIIPGSSNAGGQSTAVWNEASKHVHLINMDINAGSKTAGVQGNDTGTTILDKCDVVGSTYGTLCRYSHTLRAVSCRGNATHGHYADNLGIQLIGGNTCINGSTAKVNQSEASGGLSLTSGPIGGLNSNFQPPATSDKTFTQTFRATSLKTKTSTGDWQTYYGDTAAQNRWASTSPSSVGQITFSDAVYKFIADRKTGTTPTIRIRMRRKNTSHGSSNAIKPDPANFSSTAFSTVSGAVQGGWTGWATLAVSNFSTSGNTLLTVGTGKTDVNYDPHRYYAIWDIVEIEVTKTKNV